MEVILVGDSHLLAMGGRKSKSELPELIPVEFDGITLLYYARKGASRGPEDWRFVADNCTDRIVAVSWRGNQHNSAFLFSKRADFDFYLEGWPRVDGRTLVPQTVARAYFQDSIADLGPTIEDIRKGGARKVFVLGTPPPKGDEARLFEVVKGSEHFSGLASKHGIGLESPASLTPAPLRHKLWRLIQSMMEETAARAGAEFLSVPTEALLADGTLKPDYWGNDVTHAGEDYGRLMLSKMIGAVIASMKDLKQQRQAHEAPVQVGA